MYEPVSVVEVHIWGRLVGAVALDGSLGYYAFQYHPDFLRTGLELAPLHLPLSLGEEPVAFTYLPEVTYMRLPALLADALPDAFGNGLIDAWMAQQGVDKSQVTPLDRLAYMAKRGMGALEFRPPQGPRARQATALRMSELVESARLALRGEVHTKAALQQIIQVGSSAGGARAKAVIAWNPTTDEMHAGQFDVDEGFQHWLLKFDGLGEDSELGGSQHYGRVEYAYYKMARAAGMTMSDCRLLEEDGRAHFMTRRFDREGNQKHHLLTLCAMAHLDYRQKATHDYSQLFLTMKRLGLGYTEQEEAFRRLTFNVMGANCDDHTKNICFLLRRGGEWRLAPAYDVTHAHNPHGEWTAQHQMSVNGKFAGISRADLLAVADRHGLGTAKTVIAEVGQAIQHWPDFAEQAGVVGEEIEKIQNHLKIL